MSARAADRGEQYTGSPADGRVIRAAIVDDEGLSRRRIRSLLSAERDVVMVAEYGRVATAIAGLAASPVDLLILDIEMPRATGFELLGRLSPPPAVIFVTAHEAYARKAFDVAAVDYVLKPFDDQRFQRAVDRARRHLARGETQAQALPRDSAPTFVRRFAVKHAGAVVFLRIDEVDWLETAGNYVRVHSGNASYLMREALVRLEEAMDPQQFVRISRSVLVNIDRVARLLPSFDGNFVVELRDGKRLTLLAKYRRALQEITGRF